MIVTNNFGMHSYHSLLHNFTPVSLHVLSVVKHTLYLMFLFTVLLSIFGMLLQCGLLSRHISDIYSMFLFSDTLIHAFRL
jgi:hypothetical protein